MGFRDWFRLPSSLPTESFELPTPPEGMKIRDALDRIPHPRELLKKHGKNPVTFEYRADVLAMFDVVVLPGMRLTLIINFDDVPTVMLIVYFVAIPEIEDNLDTSFKWEMSKPVNIKKENA
jgi:hypothetical protein